MRYPTESDNLYVFSRSAGESEVIVMVNLGDTTDELKYKDNSPELADGMIDWFSGEAAVLPTELTPGEYKVFTTR